MVTAYQNASATILELATHQKFVEIDSVHTGGFFMDAWNLSDACFWSQRTLAVQEGAQSVDIVLHRNLAYKQACDSVFNTICSPKSGKHIVVGMGL